MAEGGLFGWIHGDWALKLGATGMVAPDFEGSRKYMFSATPIISLATNFFIRLFAARIKCRSG